MFKVNLQLSKDKYATLNKKCLSNTKIAQVKAYISYEFENDVPDVTSFNLKYGDILLSDNKTLNDYGIKDEKHILKIIVKVQKSNEFNEKENKENDNEIDINNIIVLEKKEKELFIVLNETINEYSKLLNKSNDISKGTYIYIYILYYNNIAVYLYYKCT